MYGRKYVVRLKVYIFELYLYLTKNQKNNVGINGLLFMSMDLILILAGCYWNVILQSSSSRRFGYHTKIYRQILRRYCGQNQLYIQFIKETDVSTP